ncbi:MAG TPA: hypothetical protein VJL35_08585 [Gemmatimonadaceae bacterium]|jgi:hypothetical protein|nr:hypothetical protein [Gemmatimonadaceae bacterium]
MVRSTATILSLAATAVISGCDSQSQLTGETCPDVAIPAITVEVRDASSRPIALGATVSVSDRKGLLEPPQVSYDSLRVMAAYGSRPGRVNVEVTKPGYIPSVARDVMLESAGMCNRAKPITIQAALVKS